MDVPPPPSPEIGTRAIRAVPPEPLVAMARPPGLSPMTTFHELDGDQSESVVTELPPELAGIHTPSPSIAPFVFGIGFCLAFLGVITNPIILIVGLLWMFAGAIVWIRIGLLESRAAADHGEAESAP